MKGASPLFSSACDHWTTPEGVLERVRRLGKIALDPCANAAGTVRASIECYAPGTPLPARPGVLHDGLGASWAKICAAYEGLAFVNPPYSKRALFVWAKKVADEARAGCEIVLLVPARTDTAWWRQALSAATGLFFFDGRLRFGNASSGAPFPSALFYYGQRPVAFHRAFRGAGWGADRVEAEATCEER